MFASTKLAAKYAIYALIATAANIGAQDLVVRAYHGTGAIVASVAMGTGVGLAIKYLLDKRYIFRFRAANVAHDTRTFALYTAMGFEFGFHHLFATREMRYLGGVIGLAIGYVAKYHLDKRYVFHTEPS